MKNQISSQCSDWQLSWGLGTNHLGKLAKGEIAGVYIWTGHQQGRHGQVWNKKGTITFRVIDDKETGESIEFLSVGKPGTCQSLPSCSEVFKAIKLLA